MHRKVKLLPHLEALLILLIFMGRLVMASTLQAPNSHGLQNLYGKPTMERFSVEPGVTLTAEYGPDGLACQLLIAPAQFLTEVLEPPAPMSSQAVSKVLEEIVPIASRGKQTDFQILGVEGNKLLRTEYESVSIRRVCSEDSCPSSHANLDVRTIVVFNRDACPRHIGQTR